MTTRRPALLLTTAVLAAALLSGCSSPADSWPDKGLRVVVSFPPLDSFARKVLGDHGTVKCLCQEPGDDVEDFEPTPEEAAMVRRADLLFINGLGLDDDLPETLRLNGANPDLKVVPLGESVPEAERIQTKDGTVDPHVWLSITRAVEMVRGVRDRLKEADAANAEAYDANAEAYVNELNDLAKDGREIVAKMNAKDRKLVCLHDALRYFASDFGLDVAGAVEVEPGAGPSESRYTKIAELCKQNEVRLIAVPKPYPDAAAKDVLEELTKRGVHDAAFVVIDPLESADDLTSPDWYKNQMANNFKALAATAPK